MNFGFQYFSEASLWFIYSIFCMTDLKKPSIITCKHLNIKQIYLNLFVHLGAEETRFEHNIDIIVSEQTVAYLHIQQTQKDIINHLESCF